MPEDLAVNLPRNSAGERLKDNRCPECKRHLIDAGDLNVIGWCPGDDGWGKNGHGHYYYSQPSSREYVGTVTVWIAEVGSASHAYDTLVAALTKVSDSLDADGVSWATDTDRFHPDE